MVTTPLGILGTGHLASYTVAGLRNNAGNIDIILSPRNRTVARNLAKKYDCEIASSNQDVIDRSNYILLAVRPHQLGDLLDGLVFESAELVISAIAGMSIKQGLNPRQAEIMIKQTVQGAIDYSDNNKAG